MENKELLDQIEELFVEIDGKCDAAFLIAETAREEVEKLAGRGLIADAARGKIMEYLNSLDFLINSISRDSDAFQELAYTKPNSGDTPAVRAWRGMEA